MAEPTEGDALKLRLLWRGLDEHPVLFANSFIVQHEQDELILTIGQFQPPILLGDASERVEQAKQLGYVPVNVIARMAFTRQRLQELSNALREHLQKFDAAHED